MDHIDFITKCTPKCINDVFIIVIICEHLSVFYVKIVKTLQPYDIKLIIDKLPTCFFNFKNDL